MMNRIIKSNNELKGERKKKGKKKGRMREKETEDKGEGYREIEEGGKRKRKQDNII